MFTRCYYETANLSLTSSIFLRPFRLVWSLDLPYNGVEPLRDERLVCILLFRFVVDGVLRVSFLSIWFWRTTQDLERRLCLLLRASHYPSNKVCIPFTKHFVFHSCVPESEPQFVIAASLSQCCHVVLSNFLSDWTRSLEFCYFRLFLFAKMSATWLCSLGCSANGYLVLQDWALEFSHVSGKFENTQQ